MRHPPPRADGRLETIVTSLEMLGPPEARAVPPPHEGVIVEQAVCPTVSFYRYLYDTVGEAYGGSSTTPTLLEDEMSAVLKRPDVATGTGAEGL